MSLRLIVSFKVLAWNLVRSRHGFTLTTINPKNTKAGTEIEKRFFTHRLGQRTWKLKYKIPENLMAEKKFEIINTISEKKEGGSSIFYFLRYKYIRELG